MPSIRTVIYRKELRGKVEARIGLFLGLMSAHTDRLFVVISLPCEKISERFYIGAKVSAHEPIFQSVATFMIVLVMKLMPQIG